MWDRILKIAFVALVIRPLVLVVLGLNLRGRRYLPSTGPCLVAANHNSHLDTAVLLSLWPLLQVHRVRPVAAADYFLKNRLIAWFSLNVIGIIPIDRSGATRNPLARCHEALSQGDMLLLYPEGTRGEPEQLSRFRRGVARLAHDHDVPIIPVYMQGLGKALPKGDFLLVPFFCDVVVGEPLSISSSLDTTLNDYTARMDALARSIYVADWE